MKPLIACLLSVLLFTSTQTLAGQKGVYYDYGRVVKVKPVYTHGYDTQSRKKCFQNSLGYHGSQKRHNNNKVLPTVAGAVVGGVIGNRLARNGHNKEIATVTGAVIGGAIGHEIADSTQNQYKHKRLVHTQQHRAQKCVKVQEYGHFNSHKKPKKIKGFRVTYRYKGEKFTTFTRQHPGGRIKLEISVRPAFYK